MSGTANTEQLNRLKQGKLGLHETGRLVIIGASLSEPHTCVTALRTCVCMSVCGHIPKILNERI